MAVTGVICEYNPFHNGHGAMLEALRRQGADTVVCAMSGNFVQRGDAAVADKFARAGMAVRCGADLVLEVPTPWAMAGAETFARGGAALLRMAGCEALGFGSECGDLDALQKAAAVVGDPAFPEAVARRMDGGASYAAARQALAEERGVQPGLLRSPNDILAVEYLKAIGWLEVDITPIAVPRVGAAHDGEPETVGAAAQGGNAAAQGVNAAAQGGNGARSGGKAVQDGNGERSGGEAQCGSGGEVQSGSGEVAIASASYIREKLRRGDMSALDYMPRAAAEVMARELAAGNAPADIALGQRAILDALRRLTEEDFADWDKSGEGLGYRICQAVRSATSWEELVEAVKTKRYPTARLRRSLLQLWLPPMTPMETPPYLRVLAANEAGRRHLRKLRDAGAPVLTKPADVDQLGGAAASLFAREALCTDLYQLCRPVVGPPGQDWRFTPIML